MLATTTSGERVQNEKNQHIEIEFIIPLVSAKKKLGELANNEFQETDHGDCKERQIGWETKTH